MLMVHLGLIFQSSRKSWRMVGCSKTSLCALWTMLKAQSGIGQLLFRNLPKFKRITKPFEGSWVEREATRGTSTTTIQSPFSLMLSKIWLGSLHIWWKVCLLSTCKSCTNHIKLVSCPALDSFCISYLSTPTFSQSKVYQVNKIYLCRRYLYIGKSTNK